MVAQHGILAHPSNTNFTYFKTHVDQKDAGGLSIAFVGGGRRLSAADVNGVRFYMNTGNIASGTIKMYGCCKPS